MLSTDNKIVQSIVSVFVDDLAKSCSSKRGIYIVLYADDILLLLPAVCELQNVLYMCERALDALDLTIKVKKSCCLRIGARNNVVCQPLYSTLYVWYIFAMGDRD